MEVTFVPVFGGAVCAVPVFDGEIFLAAVLFPLLQETKNKAAMAKDKYVMRLVIKYVTDGNSM